MKSFIEKQQSYQVGGTTGVKRTYPPKHSCLNTTKKNEYTITNGEMQKMANKGEIDKNNNNIFNGKNVSDNTKITSFYTLKSQPTYQTPLTYYGQERPKEYAVSGTAVPETSKVRELFTNNVATNQCEDCKPKSSKAGGVSNLVSEPQLNLKYDDAWFLQHNPQHWNNLRTVGLLKDQLNDEEDPIMRLNPTLYKVVDQRSQGNFTDPF